MCCLCEWWFAEDLAAGDRTSQQPNDQPRSASATAPPRTAMLKRGNDLGYRCTSKLISSQLRRRNGASTGSWNRHSNERPNYHLRRCGRARSSGSPGRSSISSRNGHTDAPQSSTIHVPLPELIPPGAAHAVQVLQPRSRVPGTHSIALSF